MGWLLLMAVVIIAFMWWTRDEKKKQTKDKRKYKQESEFANSETIEEIDLNKHILFWNYESVKGMNCLEENINFDEKEPNGQNNNCELNKNDIQQIASKMINILSKNHLSIYNPRKNTLALSDYFKNVVFSKDMLESPIDVDNQYKEDFENIAANLILLRGCYDYADLLKSNDIETPPSVDEINILINICMGCVKTLDDYGIISDSTALQEDGKRFVTIIQELLGE